MDMETWILKNNQALLEACKTIGESEEKLCVPRVLYHIMRSNNLELFKYAFSFYGKESFGILSYIYKNKEGQNFKGATILTVAMREGYFDFVEFILGQKDIENQKKYINIKGKEREVFYLLRNGSKFSELKKNKLDKKQQKSKKIKLGNQFLFEALKQFDKSEEINRKHRITNIISTFILKTLHFENFETAILHELKNYPDMVDCILHFWMFSYSQTGENVLRQNNINIMHGKDYETVRKNMEKLFAVSAEVEQKRKEEIVVNCFESEQKKLQAIENFVLKSALREQNKKFILSLLEQIYGKQRSNEQQVLPLKLSYKNKELSRSVKVEKPVTTFSKRRNQEYGKDFVEL